MVNTREWVSTNSARLVKRYAMNNCFSRILISLIAAFYASQAGSANALIYKDNTFNQILQTSNNSYRIVHFWGISCAICVEDLPKWQKLARHIPYNQIVFIQVDPVPLSSVTKQIEKNSMTSYRNYTITHELSDKEYYDVSPNWQGETPFTVLIDPSGRKHEIFGPTDMQQIATWIATGKFN